MNATKWATLSEFTMHIGKEGLAIVDETPKGWFMQWVDNSPKTLARQEAIAKKERMELDDEQREQRLIQQQIDKALALKQEQDEADGITTELVRENEEEKIKLDISIKPVSLAGGLGGGIKLGGGGLLKPKSLNALAAKKPNPFSSKNASTPTATAVSGNGSAASVTTSSASTKKRSPVEEIMEREMAKKKRLEELNSSGSGRSATHQPEPEKDRSKDSSRDDRDRDYRSSRDSRDSRDTRDRERDRDYRSSRDDRDDRDRDYRSSRDSRDDRDRDYRSSRDDRDKESYKSSRDSRDDRDRGREYGSSSRDSRPDRDYRDRERDRDSSYRDRGRD